MTRTMMRVMGDSLRCDVRGSFVTPYHASMVESTPLVHTYYIDQDSGVEEIWHVFI